MEKFKILIIGGLAIALVLSVLALIFSLKSYSAVQGFKTEIEEMNSAFKELKPLADRAKPLILTFEEVSKLMPRLQRFWLTLPGE